MPANAVHHSSRRLACTPMAGANLEFQTYGPAANTTRANLFDELRVGSSYAAVAP